MRRGSDDIESKVEERKGWALENIEPRTALVSKTKLNCLHLCQILGRSIVKILKEKAFLTIESVGKMGFSDNIPHEPNFQAALSEYNFILTVTDR